MSLLLRTWLVPLFLLAASVALAGCDEAESMTLGSGVVWPPEVGEPFPDVELTNYDGRKFKISELKGKVVLMEPVGMTCPACNALSGGNKRGGIKNIRPQRGLGSLEDYLAQLGAGITLDHPDVVLVQILLYDLSMEAPNLADVKIWAQHYGFDRNPNVYVAFSERDLRGDASFRMIPGVQLIDKGSVVRYDSTGHRPRHDLFSELLPQVPNLVRN